MHTHLIFIFSLHLIAICSCLILSYIYFWVLDIGMLSHKPLFNIYRYSILIIFNLIIVNFNLWPADVITIKIKWYMVTANQIY